MVSVYFRCYYSAGNLREILKHLLYRRKVNCLHATKSEMLFLFTPVSCKFSGVYCMSGTAERIFIWGEGWWQVGWSGGHRLCWFALLMRCTFCFSFFFRLSFFAHSKLCQAVKRRYFLMNWNYFAFFFHFPLIYFESSVSPCCTVFILAREVEYSERPPRFTPAGAYLIIKTY